MLVVTQSEVQQVIQERMKELQDLRHNVDVLKVSPMTSPSSSDLSIVALCWWACVVQLPPKAFMKSDGSGQLVSHGYGCCETLK